MVVVAYGDPEPLRRNLECLADTQRLLLVDNSSSAATAAIAATLGARYIDPGENLGFAAAVNRGTGSAGRRPLRRAVAQPGRIS